MYWNAWVYTNCDHHHASEISLRVLCVLLMELTDSWSMASSQISGSRPSKTDRPDRSLKSISSLLSQLDIVYFQEQLKFGEPLRDLVLNPKTGYCPVKQDSPKRKRTALTNDELRAEPTHFLDQESLPARNLTANHTYFPSLNLVASYSFRLRRLSYHTHRRNNINIITRVLVLQGTAARKPEREEEGERSHRVQNTIQVATQFAIGSNSNSSMCCP